MYKNYLFGTSLPFRSLVSISFLLIAAACGAGKDDDKDKDENKKVEDKKEQKIPLKISLLTPNEKKMAGMYGTRKTLNVGDLIIEVTGGKDDAANYEIKIVSTGVFSDDGYTNADGDVDGKAFLKEPIDGTDLKTIFSEDVLEKGKIKSIPIEFKAKLGYDCTSRSGRVKIAIVDKNGSTVGTPVEAKWTDKINSLMLKKDKK